MGCGASIIQLHPEMITLPEPCNFFNDFIGEGKSYTLFEQTPVQLHILHPKDFWNKVGPRGEIPERAIVAPAKKNKPLFINSGQSRSIYAHEDNPWCLFHNDWALPICFLTYNKEEQTMSVTRPGKMVKGYVGAAYNTSTEGSAYILCPGDPIFKVKWDKDTTMLSTEGLQGLGKVKDINGKDVELVGQVSKKEGVIYLGDPANKQGVASLSKPPENWPCLSKPPLGPWETMVNRDSCLTVVPGMDLALIVAIVLAQNLLEMWLSSE